MVGSAETDSPTGSTGQADGEVSDTVLRAKYADFCSAQLTEVFAGLFQIGIDGPDNVKTSTFNCVT